MYKVRQAIKRKAFDSDQDDIRGWHWESSDSSNSEK